MVDLRCDLTYLLRVYSASRNVSYVAEMTMHPFRLSRAERLFSRDRSYMERDLYPNL